MININTNEEFFKSFVIEALRHKRGTVEDREAKLQLIQEGVDELIRACDYLYKAYNQKFNPQIYIDIETLHAFILVDEGFPEAYFAALTYSPIPIHDKLVHLKQLNPQTLLGIVEE